MLGTHKGENIPHYKTYELFATVNSLDLSSAIIRTSYAAEKDEEGHIGNVYFKCYDNTFYVIAHNAHRMAAAWIGCRNSTKNSIGISVYDAQELARMLGDIDTEVVIKMSRDTVCIYYDNFMCIAKRRRGRIPLWGFKCGNWLSATFNVLELLSTLYTKRREYKQIRIIGVAVRDYEPYFVSVDENIHRTAYNADDIVTTLEYLPKDKYVDVMIRADLHHPALYIHFKNGVAVFSPIS